MRRRFLILLIPIAVAGCANNGLRDLQPPSSGPDEFLVQPAKQLVQPPNYTTLPPPTPGEGNLVDRSALDEGVAAVGGRPERADAAVPASDGALVQYASRLGVSPNIRDELAQEDADFRRRQARFTQIRLFQVDRYNEAYRRQKLDAAEEARKWRRAGARTPSSPPS
ncbi:MAG: DUF3035 domain-containing protein [Pseudomonadota bacterium]